MGSGDHSFSLVRYLNTPGSYKHSHETDEYWTKTVADENVHVALPDPTCETVRLKYLIGSLLHKFAYNWNSIFWWMKKTVQRDFHYLYSILKIYPTMQMGKKGNKYRYNCICGTYKLYLQAIQLYLQAIQKQYALGITAVLFSLS